MKIAYSSDLHFEFNKSLLYQFIQAITDDIDVLILAGDIDKASSVKHSIEEITKHCPSLSIIFVPGNHEFYSYRVFDQIEEFDDMFNDNTQIHVLQNKSITLDSITFIGSTLWTDFSAHKQYSLEESMKEAAYSISDFHLIKGMFGYIDADEMRQLCLDSKDFLLETLKEFKSKKSVVITHFPPLIELKHKHIATSVFSNYFQTDCADIAKMGEPNIWIYGHNHYSDDQKHFSTQFISHQYGYPDEKKPVGLYGVIEL